MNFGEYVAKRKKSQQRLLWCCCGFTIIIIPIEFELVQGEISMVLVKCQHYQHVNILRNFPINQNEQKNDNGTNL